VAVRWDVIVVGPIFSKLDLWQRKLRLVQRQTVCTERVFGNISLITENLNNQVCENKIERRPQSLSAVFSYPFHCLGRS